jgi:signal transduction histidine kinase
MTCALRVPAPTPTAGPPPEVRDLCFRPPGPDGTRPCLDELLGTLAHELRSPLVAIVNAAQVTASECDTGPLVRRALAAMERQSRQALRIIDDLFDLCAGAQGKLSLRKEVVALADLVAVATETTGHLLAARQHRLTVSLPPGPVSLEGDPPRLAQVLTNLLGNAAKFTDPGGHIRLTAQVEAGQVVLRVQDNGRGIPPDLLPRVFDPFYQVPGPGQQATGGLGIGLALVKSLVELHGGSVAARSDGPGTGCEFVVCLPACAPDRAGQGGPGAVVGPPHRCYGGGKSLAGRPPPDGT